jgi:hypothetical protein
MSDENENLDKSESPDTKNGDHRGNGKIARLPKNIRDLVNSMSPQSTLPPT